MPKLVVTAAVTLLQRMGADNLSADWTTKVSGEANQERERVVPERLTCIVGKAGGV
jgi:hypothetical protein